MRISSKLINSNLRRSKVLGRFEMDRFTYVDRQDSIVENFFLKDIEPKMHGRL